MRKPGHLLRYALALSIIVAGVIASVALSGGPVRARGLVRHAPAPRVHARSGSAPVTYSTLATRSIGLLESSFFDKAGWWHMCLPLMCNTKNRDWGADSLTNLLYLRWVTSHDPSVVPIMNQLAQTAHSWAPGAAGSSDSVMWDAVADVRMYQVTGSATALAKAQAAMSWLGSVPGLAAGACPAVDYQWPNGQRGDLKTIETASNYIKAALLLYKITGTRSYLTTAQSQYAQVRSHFLARSVPLYTAYVFDNGSACRVLPGRYFASVNGNMIWAGQALAAATGRHSYLAQALATARAVRAHLSDGAGIFADLQADNDIVAPLVEAMYSLTTTGHQAFAAHWLMASASAAGADDNALGEFGRFFDGPPPGETATAWQMNGGIAVTLAAAALDPGGHPADPGFWAGATYVADSQALAGTAVTISFTGRAVALMGTIGATCCIQGHARVFIDGAQTFNKTGIWQGYSSPSRRQPGQVLFAWRWKAAGHHVITIKPGRYDRLEGGPFFQMDGYLLVP